MYPAVFYIAPFIVIVLLWLTFNSRRKGKDIIFGVGLFLITVALVLQILPVGGAIIAERYTYIPYIGIFFIIARYMNNLLENKTTWLKAYRIPLMIIFTTVSVAYAYVAFQRTMVWKDSISLWTDAINKFDKYPLAYSLRGVAYYKEGQYENAVSDLSNYILLNKNKPSVFYDRGLCYLELKKSNEAIEDFNMAIKLKPNYADAYYNRGSVYNDIGNFEEAIQDYTKAIRLYPGYKKAFYNRAGAYYLTHRFRQALDDAEQAQKLGYNVGQDFINAIKTGLDQNHP